MNTLPPGCKVLRETILLAGGEALGLPNTLPMSVAWFMLPSTEEVDSYTLPSFMASPYHLGPGKDTVGKMRRGNTI